MKKVFALVLALCMVALSLGVAMAEGPSITVNGLEAGDNVKYVQVIAWDTTNGWVKATGFSGLSDDVFNEVVGTQTTPGKITDASATAIAAIGAAMTDGGSVATGATSWSKDGLTPGLYMVQPVAASADVIYNPIFVAIQADGTSGSVTLPLSYADNGTVKKSTITLDKKAKSQGETEWAKATTEDVGDIIDYKVETTVPAFLESYTAPVFTVTDQLSDGLTFAIGENGALTDITVKAGSTPLTLNTDYKVTEKDASHWLIEFQDSYLKGRTTATPITIEYQAKITDAAKNVNPETNTVTIEYSRNPSDSSDHGTREDKTKHYTFDIDAGLQGDAEYITSEIIKVAVDANGNPILAEQEYHNKELHHPLAGAKFQLYKANGTDFYSNSTINAGQKFETDEMGRMEIKGLDEGTYILKESDPAPGYMLVTTPLTFVIEAHYKDVPATDTCNAYKELDYYEVKVNGTTTSHYTIDNGTVVKKTDGTAGDVGTEIENPQGASLPSTGGIGTTIFYILGGLLVVGAVVILVARRKAQD